MDPLLTIDTMNPAEREVRSRRLSRCPEAIEVAVRRVVHDYVDGWGIVLPQSPQSCRRKKRIKNRRTHERQTFNRPVWVHQARWAGDSSSGRPRIQVVSEEESIHGGLYLVHDLSYAGMGLVGDRAPKSRLIVLEFDSWRGRSIEIVLYLRWRRRVSFQEYRCGGSILGVLTPE